MPTIDLKNRGDLFGEHDPKLVAMTEMRSFRSEDGREYIVKRFPRSSGGFSYHVYMEVSNSESAHRFLGVDSDVPEAKWWKIWPEEKTERYSPPIPANRNLDGSGMARIWDRGSRIESQIRRGGLLNPSS
jgi:hypothetical protein